MNRKILGSVLAILAALALTASTFAAFTDGRTATTSLETGSIDLDFGTGSVESIVIEGVQPGYAGSRTVDLVNTGSLNGVLTAQVVKVYDDEVGPSCTSAEVDAGDITCTAGANQGELGTQLVVSVGTAITNQILNAVDGAPPVPVGSIAAGATLPVDLAYGLPDLGNANNLVQTERLNYNVVFTLTQDPANAATTVAQLPEGWMINRDAGTSTPWEMSTAQSTIGTGSLHVLPIGTNPRDKFIAELVLMSPTASITRIAYDYYIEERSANDDGEFYLNVYTIFPGTDPATFYDCKFDYTPTNGVLDAWATARFNATDTPTRVQKWSGSIAPGACPATLAAMPAGSIVRFVAFNVGDTGASGGVGTDAGVEGYLDNVRIVTTAGTQVTDFEPVGP